jgi:glyoxylase-like metal-dependent hydrolase (beta-lactamase superfamily II)
MPWSVGGVRITRVVEQVTPFPVDFFVEATPADVAAEKWLVPDYVDADGHFLMSIHTYVVESVVESGTLRIVVDTCVGNSKPRPQIPEFDRLDRPFLADLTEAGFAPDTIDVVVCTHLHVDHTGWNTWLVGGEWIPTVPRARYVFPAADADYFARSREPLHASTLPIPCGR